MSIRAIAISAPEHSSGVKDGRALNSSDPVSLFNALRSAASAAAEGRGPWGASNWAGSRDHRRHCCLLMYSLDDFEKLDVLLEREQPNLVLIGAMSICMRGAIECAQHVRARMGAGTLIVLGGRHASETVYRAQAGRSDEIEHHAGSPLRLMSTGRIAPVFDLVVGGEAEDVIYRVGAAIERRPFEGAHDRARVLSEIAEASGNWVAGVVEPDGAIRTIGSARRAIDRNLLSSGAWLFGVSTKFDVFGGAYTAHAFSDTGQGCAFDCDFCSERASVVGKPQDVDGAARRLYRHMHEAVEVIADQHPGARASAFVEDSILLMGKKSAVSDFCKLMESRPLPLTFGAQMTVDQILARPEEVKRLSSVGLSYLFIGIETLVPLAIGGMSKDRGRAVSAWDARIEAAIEQLTSMGIGVGAALLFGLGESARSRERLFEFLERLRARYGSPHPLSMNWAVQHPLKGFDRGADYDYTGWPVVGGDMLRLFHAFGEASTEYFLPHVGRPDYREVLDVVHAYRALSPIARPVAPESARWPADPPWGDALGGEAM